LARIQITSFPVLACDQGWKRVIVQNPGYQIQKVPRGLASRIEEKGYISSNEKRGVLKKKKKGREGRVRTGQ